MSIHTHYDVLQRVMERLKALPLDPVKPDAIYEAEFPFTNTMAPGIACSEIPEAEGLGTNERDDFLYGVQLVRIFGGDGRGKYQKGRSTWRHLVRRELHRKLLGGIEGEIFTKVKPSTITLARNWQKLGIDSSVLEVWCWVREVRYERLD